MVLTLGVNKRGEVTNGRWFETSHMRYNLLRFNIKQSQQARAQSPAARSLLVCHVVLQYPTLSHGAHAARFTQWQSSTNVDLAFETILIEIYRIVTRKTL